MKAVFFEQHGGAEVLKYGQMPDPVLGDGDVLVQIKACALNHLDIWVRNGLPGISIPMPHILGADVSGIIPSTGARVLISPGQLPLKAVSSFEGRDSYSPEFHILGFQTQGGYAEFVKVPNQWIIPISEKYSFEEWAACPLVSLTAYHMLVTRAQLKKGETVLIHAGGSGVGSMAIQLAKYLGARVITTVGDAGKVERTKELGADHVILYKNEDFSEAVKKITGGEGVDLVFEHIGPDVWQKSLISLKRGGRLVTCGATSGGRVDMELRIFFSKQLSILGSYMGSFAELKAVLELIEKGHIKPVVDKVFPLKDAAEAHRRMEARQNFGKIILKP